MDPTNLLILPKVLLNKAKALATFSLSLSFFKLIEFLFKLMTFLVFFNQNILKSTFKWNLLKIIAGIYNNILPLTILRL